MHSSNRPRTAPVPHLASQPPPSLPTDGDGDAQYESYAPRPVNYLEEAINIVPRHVSPSQSSHRVINQDPLPLAHPAPHPDETIPRISGGKCNRDQDGESTDEASPAHKRARREKGTLPLDVNQPLTTRGKPRARVYVACLQCRNRKIRCDGARPACHNCTVKGNPECNYDALPRRRGPDKVPGARQRPSAASGRSTSRRRTSATADSYTVPSQSTSRRNSVDELDLQPQASYSQQQPREEHLYFEEYDIQPYRQQTPYYQAYGDVSPEVAGLAPRSYGEPSTSYEYPYHYANQVSPSPLPLVSCLTRQEQGAYDYRDDFAPRPSTTFLSQPSMQFSRSTWWDNLLSLYSAPAANYMPHISASQREWAAQQITSDLRFMFRVSNYWFSFFHVPTFFGTFHNAYRRDNMQPGLVYGALAISIFFRSSQLEGKEMGRERALRFRDMAQGYIDAAYNAQSIDLELAQAAWLAALFEVCAHPLHSTPRCAAALRILDAIIQSLQFTSIDYEDPRTSMFNQSSVPVARARVEHVPGTDLARTHAHPQGPCECLSFTLKHNRRPEEYVPPTWEMTPAWDPKWTEAEIEKESSRRLLWSSLYLFSGHHTYNLSYGRAPVALHISAPSNYAVFFTGESSIYSMRPASASLAKETVWALFERSFLLWNATILMVMRTRSPLTRMSDVEKAHFAISVNQEADAIEAALRGHTCEIERAFLFHSRDYLFSARMCVGYEYRRVLPATSVFYGTEDMLKKMSYRIAIGRQVMQGLHTVTGNATNTLNRRPFFVFWFMAQIKSAIRLYKSTDLPMALELCKALMPCVDYLSTLFPCPEQRVRYAALVQEVNEACLEHGQPLYEQLDFTSVMSNPNQNSARLTTYED
ncbi:hypothetical protein K523DRAFT_292090 [Schizophyllum commune Tattone D]|nr:hypothetical protein K523DRAFT_292090 [Schizophyllum commune Tattone D]